MFTYSKGVDPAAGTVAAVAQALSGFNTALIN